MLPCGLNSNRAQQLQLVIKDWTEIYKSPPKLDAKLKRTDKVSDERPEPELLYEEVDDSGDLKVLENLKLIST